MSHSVLFAPSSLHRRVRCPASGTMEAQIPDEAASIYAEEGTAAHKLGEQVLQRPEFMCVDYIGTEIHPGFMVDDEMAGYVQAYVDGIRELVGVDNLLWVEQKVSFSEYAPDGYGTSDAVVYVHDDKRLIVNDLKYGKGIRVDAQENEQLQAYGLGTVLKYTGILDIELVTLRIHQPRLDHISEWTVTLAEIYEFGDLLKSVAELVLSENPPFRPGEKQCRWCKAKAVCKPHAESNLTVITGGQVINFEDLTKPLDPVVPNALTNEQIAQLLPEIENISEWCSAIKAHAQHQLESGYEIPGYKLVRGRAGIRSWIDEAEAEKKLRNMRFKVNDIFVKKLITPAKSDKLLNKDQREKMSDLIRQPEGKPTIAPDSDKRPAINVKPDFENLESASA
ncbi:MAG: DUF2800 domain-containing protein [Candidatus Thiodiazotropha taylori]|uniref:DUF2800 domain-containing protein n=1 Tax=Candidatus Thiodiazotropha taylori TaxID=2792791 RepID=A0A9E4N5Z5_9GAMM|nr:DUF2800 domain-containing protein [Candidatus Thiodiazotropha taylori]MCW4258179.1 DUF2800 domain-containing protein [Candidatus Thiodiazotropha taylori]